MKRSIPVVAAAAAAAVVCVVAFTGRGDEAPPPVQPLTVERYCDVALAQLRFAESLWREQGRAPTDADDEPLWSQHATTREAYYAFMSAHRPEVEAHLESHPEAKAEIEALSAAIRDLIAESEPDQPPEEGP
jgi:hypothetical protein